MVPMHIADKLRSHLADDHRRGCAGRMYACECGYDAETGRLIRQAILRLDELEAIVRGWRERKAIDREDEPP
jgi:hypothetical protein